MVQIAQEVEDEATRREREYLQAVKAGEKPLAHQYETSRELWDSFNSDRHPKLVQAVKTVKKWYNERINKGGALVLAGGYGCGKSHLARAIHQMYGPLSTFWYEPDLFGAIRDTYDDSSRESEYQIFKSIRQKKLLIIDDLGSYEVEEGNDKSEKFVQRVYQMLLDGRYEKGNATLITTNLSDPQGQLRKRLGERCYDRLVGALEYAEFYIDMFGVPSYRRRNFTKKG